MRKPTYQNIIGSTIKVVASADLKLEELEKQDDNNKSISQLLNEQEKKGPKTKKVQ